MKSRLRKAALLTKQRTNLATFPRSARLPLQRGSPLDTLGLGWSANAHGQEFIAVASGAAAFR